MGKILWIASFPKSGNTWLRAFLHNLIRNPEDGYDINRLNEFSIGDSYWGWYRHVDPSVGPGTPMPEVAKIRPKAHMAMTKAHPDTIFVKTHNALVEDFGIPMITMEATAGAIYVVRNPLDVVISFKHYYGITLDEAIKRMNDPALRVLSTDVQAYQVYRSWSDHVRSWTLRPSPGLHFVRYEDMLEKPLPTFGGVAAFLGLGVAPARLQRAIDLASFENLRKQEDKHGFQERAKRGDRFFREGKAGQWKQVLTPAQVDAIVDAHQEQMTKFGYLPLA